MVDRTLNTLLKDVFLKGFLVVYESQSPTQNKAEAIQDMLEAGEFVRRNGHLMNAEQLIFLSELSTKWVYFSPLSYVIHCEPFDNHVLQSL